jgi:hypothetical protein
VVEPEPKVKVLDPMYIVALSPIYNVPLFWTCACRKQMLDKVSIKAI